MPGMDTGLSTNNPAVVSAFQSALLHQGLVVLLIMAIVAVAWSVERSAQLRTGQGGTARRTANAVAGLSAEPVARRLLRIAFGVIWIFDGIPSGPGYPCPSAWPLRSSNRQRPARQRGSSTWTTSWRRSGATTLSTPRLQPFGSRWASE